LDHPYFGAVAVSFCLWNWPLAVWFVGAVTGPGAAVAGMQEYVCTQRVGHLIVGPVLSGIAFAHLAPTLFNVYLAFDLLMGRWKARLQGRSQGLDPVKGIHFANAISALKSREDQSTAAQEAVTTLLAEVDNARLLLNRDRGRFSDKLVIAALSGAEDRLERLSQQLAELRAGFQKIDQETQKALNVAQRGRVDRWP
jgi:hypothetical protein